VEPLQPVFKTVPLDLRDWALIIVAAGIPTFAMGLGSVLGTSKQKKSRKISYGGNSIPPSVAR
jgi:Ca2+-transporting ATPase